MQLTITFLSDEDSWINSYISSLSNKLTNMGHHMNQINKIANIPSGDVLFILSFSKLVPKVARSKNSHNIIIHESNLPKGRGWSPTSWQILEGINIIPVSLFEAEDKVDSGEIYLQGEITLEGNELLPEIHAKQAAVTTKLCLKYINNYPQINKLGNNQKGKPTYYPRRAPTDSELNSQQSLLSLFNLLRIVDNDKYPAFFSHQGIKYILKISKDKT